MCACSHLIGHYNFSHQPILYTDQFNKLRSSTETNSHVSLPLENHHLFSFFRPENDLSI